MASTNLTSGRPDPRITGLLGKAASGNAGKYIADKLPIHHRLTDASFFSGKVRSLPLNQVYGASTMVGTSALKRAPNGAYANVGRDRTFAEVSYECDERSAKVDVDQLEVDRTSNTELAALSMRDSRAMQLYAAILDDFEYEIVTALASTAAYPDASVAALTGGAQVAWNAAGSSPARDGVACRNLIRGVSGTEPSFGVVSNDVLEALRYHPETLGIVMRGTVANGFAAAAVSAALLRDDEVLTIWARLWGLRDGLFAIKAMRNTANPILTGTLAEMATGIVAFHCADGLQVPASQVVENVEVYGGAQSILCVRESSLRGYEDANIDPHGIQLVAKHSYDIVVPNANAAFVLTSILG